MTAAIRAVLCGDRGGNYKKPNKLQVDDVLMDALICLSRDMQVGLSGYNVGLQICACSISTGAKIDDLDLQFFHY